MRRDDDFLVERWIDGKLAAQVTVRRSNSGRFIAEYKLGTVRFDVPTSGSTAAEAMKNARAWLRTPIGKR